MRPMTGKIAIVGARVCTPFTVLEEGDVLVDAGRIAAVGRGLAPDAGAEAIPGAGRWCLPGLVDLGAGIRGEDARALRTAGRSLARHGVTGFLATVAGKTEESLRAGLDAVEQAMDAPDERGAALLGARLDLGGRVTADDPPRLGAERLAALVERFGDILRLAVLLPGEVTPAVVQLLARRGIVPMLDRADATEPRTRQLLDAGVRHAADPFSEWGPAGLEGPGDLGVFLTDPRVTVEIPPGGMTSGMLQLVLRACGADRILATSEATCPLNEAVGLLAHTGGAGVPDAARMATWNPAGLLGLSHRRGVVAAGYDADLVVVDGGMRVHATLRAGRILYRRR